MNGIMIDIPTGACQHYSLIGFNPFHLPCCINPYTADSAVVLFAQRAACITYSLSTGEQWDLRFSLQFGMPHQLWHSGSRYVVRWTVCIAFFEIEVLQEVQVVDVSKAVVRKKFCRIARQTVYVILVQRMMSRRFWCLVRMKGGGGRCIQLRMLVLKNALCCCTYHFTYSDT